MATAPNPISFDEYLVTSYSPDCEYIDGVIIERNLGQGKHSYTQGRLILRLEDIAVQRGLVVLPEQRTKIAPFRVRVPDVSVVVEVETITTIPPQLCVEIWSPDDRWSIIAPKVSDYLEMGVPCVWVIDPWSRRAWVFDAESGPTEVAETLHARHLNLEITLESLLLPN